MKYLPPPVLYLEDQDFSQSGDLICKYIPRNTPVVILIQSLNCGHCTMAKPAFYDFALQTAGNVICATIQGDGETESEQRLMSRILTIKPDLVGFPAYVLYYNGKRIDKEIQRRDLQGLYAFVNEIRK